MVSRRQVASSPSRSTHLRSPLRARFWIIDRVCPRNFGFGFKLCMLVFKWTGGEIQSFAYITICIDFELIRSILYSVQLLLISLT